MSARWALLVVFLLAAWGARAELGQKSFTPVIPTVSMVPERAEPLEVNDESEPLTRNTAAELNADLNTGASREHRAILLDGED